MQRALNVVAERPTPLRATGVFNAATDAALRAWQRKVGLTPSGIVDKPTWRALDAGKLR